MSTSPVKEIHELSPAIERWEDIHRRYSQTKDCEQLEGQQEMVSLPGVAPESLQGHLQLNVSKLTSYGAWRHEMVQHVENRRAFSEDSGAVPVESERRPKGRKGERKGRKRKETERGEAQATRKARAHGKARELDGRRPRGRSKRGRRLA